jgi:crossover junction endodeoxyribonuclease RuvC
MTVILGIDPGLNFTGWGIISSVSNRLSYIASGTISPSNKLSLNARLLCLHSELTKIIDQYTPTECAIEESFVNQNAATSLKLGCARGAIMLSIAIAGMNFSEYAPRLVKKTVVGTGSAEKSQVEVMIKYLLPSAIITSKDSADALAVAICHSGFIRNKI